MQVDRRIYFGVNESSIPSRFYGDLEALAVELRENPKPVHVLVEGHADEIGASTRNQVLSEQRAAKVRLVLQQAGVPADRIRAVGFGDTRPAVPGRHAMNRRVEIKLE
jgi:outer membrane protein OmpA-like peptidoglycan-associated protein